MGLCFLDSVSTVGLCFPDGMALTAFASLMDSLVLDSFWQRVIPNLETNFLQQVSIEDLITNQSPRALLAFSQRWAIFKGGALLLGPGVLTVEEEVAWISSGVGSSISVSSGALTWEDVSTSLEKSSGLGVGVWLRPWVLDSLGWNTLMHAQRCLIPPGIGPSSLLWSCFHFLYLLLVFMFHMYVNRFIILLFSMINVASTSVVWSQMRQFFLGECFLHY